MANGRREIAAINLQEICMIIWIDNDQSNEDIFHISSK